ncbi:MAG: hypothetical protein K2G93_07165, partial [Rikenella sp.]|nr:hypothetical protein [Rikenella sp.]
MIGFSVDFFTKSGFPWYTHYTEEEAAPFFQGGGFSIHPCASENSGALSRKRFSRQTGRWKINKKPPPQQ